MASGKVKQIFRHSYSTLADFVSAMGDLQPGEFVFGRISGDLYGAVTGGTADAYIPAVFARITDNAYTILAWHVGNHRMYIARYIVSSQTFASEYVNTTAIT